MEWLCRKKGCGENGKGEGGFWVVRLGMDG